MAHKINTMLATTYYLSSSQNINFSNDLTSSLTQVTVPIAYYTTFLINTASSDFSDGTVDKPYCLLQKVREKVGDYFDFTLSTDGKTEIRYRGYTTGSISFASSSVIKNLLGFTDTTITFNSGTVLTSAYQPYGAVFSINSTDTQGWETEYSQTAYSETAVGAVFGFKDDYFLTSRKQTLKFFPRDQDAKNQLATIPTTPIFPVSKSLISGSSITSNWGQPVSDPLSYSPPYTFLNFLRTAPGYPVRTVFGTFQENISGSNLNYDCVYLRPSFIEKKGFQTPSIKNYDLLRDVPDLEIILCNSGSISGVRTVFSGSAITAPTAAFSPSDVANLYVWYRGDLVTYDGSNKVSVWPDKSGNGKHLSQSNGSYQPTYVSSISTRNNQPGIHATVGAYLQAENFALRTLKTVIIAVGTTGSMGYILTLTSGSTEHFYAYHPGNATFYNRDNTSTQHYITNTGGNFIVANTHHTFLYDAVTPKLYRNDSNVAGPDVGSVLSDIYITGSFSLFSAKNGISSSTLQILEVLVYNKALNSTERTQVWNYLATRYGS